MTQVHDECFKYASENNYALIRYAQGDWEARDAELLLYTEIPGKPPLVGAGLTERAVNCLRSVEWETRDVSPTVSRAANIIRLAAGRDDVPCAAFVPAHDATELEAYLRWLDSVAYSDSLRAQVDFKGGLLPVGSVDPSRVNLIVKSMREIAATARLQGSFRLYLVPVRAGDVDTFSLVSAFFDDHDEPLVIRTPLFDDELLHSFLQALSSDSFDIHFFDEHNRILAGFRAENPDAARFRQLASTFQFVPGSIELARQFDDHMISWFGNRSTADDDASFTIDLSEPLTPDNLWNDNHDAPGDLNEGDIETALYRAFNHDDVFRNPIRPDTGREFVDVLVATSETVLLIQAKDSPINEASLGRTIDRKKAVARKHVKKASSQLRGSINHLRSSSSIDIVTDGQPFELSISGRDVFGLVVVKELFDAERWACSRPILSVAAQTGVPCLLLDYMEFQELTYSQPTEENLVATLKQAFASALEQGLFLRSRFGMVADGPIVHSIPTDASSGPPSPPSVSDLAPL